MPIYPRCHSSYGDVNAATSLSEQADGSAVTFFGGTLNVSIDCAAADRHLPWGIWIATTENCSTRSAAFTVVGPNPLEPVTVDDRCAEEPMSMMTEGANNHLPLLKKAASFEPYFLIDAQGNTTAMVGTYTVHCGAQPCWVVDNRAVAIANGNALIGTAVAGFQAFFMFFIASGFGCTGSLLCLISCCIACASEEPNERSTKGRLMDEEEGDESQ